MQNVISTALVWLRNDLRYEDQLSFLKASKSGKRVVAYFSFEPRWFESRQWGFRKIGSYRLKFLIDTLAALQKELESHNITLIVSCNDPSENIPVWVEKLNADSLYFQKEWTREERDTELRLRKNLPHNVQLFDHCDQFLYHPEDVSFDIDRLNNVFTAFRKKCEKFTSIRPLLEKPNPLPESNKLKEKFSLPTFEKLNSIPPESHPYSAFPFKGGTQAGKERLNYYLWETQKLSVYKKTRNGLLGTDYSSKFSPWLANGALSPRMIYWEIIKYEKTIKKNDSTYWLIFELTWRDYFKYVSLKHGNAIFRQKGILEYEYDWKSEEKTIAQWVNGKTKEPFVNANMLELKKTGFMSNRGRQNVASYFAKDLLLDWRIGAAYFEEQLIDYDVHSNYGNWMYVSGVGNDPRDRKFNVRFQAERYDEKGTYQKRWNQNTLFE